MSTQVFQLSYPWDQNGYCPRTEFRLYADREGFHLHTLVEERNPRRQETRHMHDVYTDSCTEWFVNFLPEAGERYFNFEVNANGAMYVSYRTKEGDLTLLTEAEIGRLRIRTRIASGCWEVSYCVPYDLIQHYIPSFRPLKQMQIRTNFYKCGDHTPYPHYGIWHVYDAEKPDFHRPEHFETVTVSLEGDRQ